MARLARIVLPNIPHHVTQRGVRSINIFSNDKDRLDYLKLLKEQSEIAGLAYLSYCLMDNHVHFIVIPTEKDSLRRGIGESNRLYTIRLNKRENTAGYLFQGRFFSSPLDQQHLLNTIRYIERNPVRAGICANPEDYFWSSARYHVGLEKNDILVESGDWFGIHTEWKEFISGPCTDITQIEKCLTTGRPMGDDKFVKYAEKVTGRELRYKKMGRPFKL